MTNILPSILEMDTNEPMDVFDNDLDDMLNHVMIFFREKIMIINEYTEQLHEDLTGGKLDFSSAKFESNVIKKFFHDSENEMKNYVQSLILNKIFLRRMIDIDEMITGLIPCCSKSLKRKNFSI